MVKPTGWGSHVRHCQALPGASASKSNISQEHTEGLRGDVSAAFPTAGKADGERLPARRQGEWLPGWNMLEPKMV